MSNRRSIMPFVDRNDAGPVGGPRTGAAHDVSEEERGSRLTRTIEGEIVPRLLICSSVSQRSGALAEDSAELARLLQTLTRLETALLEANAETPVRASRLAAPGNPSPCSRRTGA
jgi:hypothetical protein